MPKSRISLLLTWSLVIYQGSCDKMEKIAQQPSNVLVDYSAYRHISIIHFNVPENTVVAIFKYTAKEEKTGGIGSCSPRNVSIYLKPGSLPLVSPDRSKIAAKLLKERYRYRELNILSDGKQHPVKIDAPPSGDWFTIGFRSWTDPNNGKITQQGLGASCDTILDAELLIERAETVSIVDDRTIHWIQLNSTADSAVMQFLVPEGFESRSTLSLRSSCDSGCKIAVNITTREHLADAIINTKEITVPFEPYSNSFHYVTLRLLSGPSSNVSVLLQKSSPRNTNDTNVKLIKLIRKSLPDFFLFDYEYLQKNDSKPSPLNLTYGTLSILEFEIGPVYDVGGTLTIGLKLSEATTTNDTKVVVVGCVTFGYYSYINAAASCVVKDKAKAADIYVNETGPSYVHVPFPEPGTWHVSLKAFCIEKNCNCSKDCLTSVCQGCECIEECSSKVEINVASSPCIEGNCNWKGRCVHYMSGGFVFSACQCSGGYSGFDCADDKYVIGTTATIVSLLLLTVSNLAFVGSIYIAIRREYYTEAAAYSAVLFFSTFYHACESGGDIYNFCIMRLNVLQFCDFFNALLAFWVTLVAMAAFDTRLTAFCQVVGAIVLAMGAEMDRTSLWVFLVPAVTGSAIVIASWGTKCKSKRTFKYPGRPYQTIFLPAGLLLVFLGLMCFAFLQTRQNYYLVHSFWHMCVAFGVILLLPKREYMK